jgi:uncharacterized protein
MNKKWWIGALALTGAAVLVKALFLEQYFFNVTRHTIGNVKTGSKSIRLLLLTDLHLNYLLQRHHRLAAKVNQLRPDLIMIAGDALDEHAASIKSLKAFLELLDPDIPKVAVMGNHDHKSGASLKQYCKAYILNNCHLLVNETISFVIKDTRLSVTGLDDFIESHSDVNKAFENTRYEANHLLLIHSPLQQEETMRQVAQLNQSRVDGQKIDISYIFAGHNHGGQVRLPGYVPKLPEKSGDYVNGWYNDKKPYLYISRGYGTSALPVRFGARAEVTLFEYLV